MKKIIFLFSFLLLPKITLAHVKWFAEPEKLIPDYKITDGPVLLGLLALIIAVGIGILLERKLKIPSKLQTHLESLAPIALSLASIGFGFSFIIFSLNGFIFAPNLEAIGAWGNIMLCIQALAGVMILLGLYERLGGLMIILLFALGIKEYGGIEMLDTLEMVGFALYAMIIGRPKWKIRDTELFKKYTHRIHEYGLPILRVGTGLNLIVLGFTEKILSPSLTDNFLSTHPWNFMQALGFESYTNYWFAFSAGTSEILFGLFFLFGIVTRLTTVALAVFLITTLYLLGPIELIGHLPHFSIAIVLLILGSGSRLLLIKKN